MFLLELIPSGLFLVLLFNAPKSLRWVVLKGNDSKVLEILNKIKGTEEAQLEMKNIKASLNETESKVKLSYFSKGVFVIIAIGAVLSMLQQFIGINAVLYYGAHIFEKALGFGKDDILLQQILQDPFQ